MQFIDLKAQYAALKDPIDRAIRTVLDEGQYIMGGQVKELEDQIAEYVGVKHVISCSNGTDALQMLYIAYEIGVGDAIFCPDITFVATEEPACMLGALPVFCDVEKGTYNISPKNLRRQIEAVKREGKYRPRAVVTVDILGNPADYEELTQIADEHGLLLIQDAAQSFGAEYSGKKCGSFGDSAITSFFPAKPLGCYGDGGAIMTNNDAIAEICRSIRVHGKGASKYENIRIGMNSRLDTIQAAILQVKLKALREYEMAARQRIAKRYDEALSGTVEVINVKEGNLSAYAQYVMLLSDTARRDAVAARLKKMGIPTMVYYPFPQHALKVFENTPTYGETFATSNDYCARTLSIPMHPYLDDETQDRIIASVMEAVR